MEEVSEEEVLDSAGDLQLLIGCLLRNLEFLLNCDLVTKGFRQLLRHKINQQINKSGNMDFLG